MGEGTGVGKHTWIAVSLVAAGALCFCGGLGGFAWFGMYQFRPEMAPPTSERKPADSEWAAYEQSVSQWRERIDTFSGEDRKSIDELEADTALDAEGVGFVARWVDSLRRERLIDAFLERAFAPGGGGTELLAQDAETSVLALERLRAKHGAFGGSHTPRHNAVRPVEGRVFSYEEFPGWFERGFADVDIRLVWSREAGWRVDRVVIAERAPREDDPIPDGDPRVPVANGAIAGDELVRQTCGTCKAVRFGRTGALWQIAVARPGRDGCIHQWRDGASKGMHPSVPDGRVVLVLSGHHVGAFILRRQRANPDRMSVEWVYRAAFGRSLDPADSEVESGSADDGSNIRFASFRVRWSAAGDGAGWLYYPNSIGEEIPSNAIGICVTEETSFADVDPYARRWIYRSSGSDPGKRHDDK